ncbi:MAG: carboxylesterase/lipase family protein [Dehalococcoidia bacterium]|nr:carboxylesterase/lipase family protein [Dehalococcoidia bacterium]
MSTAVLPVVNTNAGKVEGYYRDGLFVFKGIPYAAPPAGENRWLPPQPVKPWSGVRDAKNFGAICPQNEQQIQIIRALQPEPQSEDCLFLNLWTPGLDDARHPVMVWIHGGGFAQGSGSSVGYNGRKLATRGNTVIVTINYRLGTLGFWNLNEVTGGKIPAKGNEGLLDQIAALEWVRNNISSFGGDPNNVTIFGESAGGMSCGCLLAMPRARGLFHRAIPQSGAASTATPLTNAREISELFLQTLGIEADDVKALRALTPVQLLAAHRQFVLKLPTINPKLGTMPFQPVIDGKELPTVPLAEIKKGASTDIPVLVGSTLNEWGLFTLMDPDIGTLSEPHLVARLRRFVPTDYISGLIDAYRKAREKRGQPTTPGDIFTAIQTDRIFRLPAIRLAEAKHKKPAFHYIFTWQSPALGGKLGSCHAIDVGIVWGSYEKNFCGEGPAMDALSAKVQDGWLAFARHGDPSSESLGKWPPYSANRETMLLGEKCELENDPFGEERKAWEAIPEGAEGRL